MTKKLNMQKVLATGALVIGGAGIVISGIGMVKQVDATNQTASSTSQTTENKENKERAPRPELTEEQKTAMESAKQKAIASLSTEDQKVLTDLEAKGHFTLTFTEREQLSAIHDKVMTYMSENPVEGLPTPPSKDGKRGNKGQMDASLTDAQKTELDTLKAEGIAQLTQEEQSRLKEIDAKDRMTQTDEEREELHTLIDKVMTYVKSKASFTMPEKQGKGSKQAQTEQEQTTQSTQTEQTV